MGDIVSKEDQPLTLKQQAFVEQLFICNFNGVEAVLQAGYDTNRHNARFMARDLRKHPIIAKIIRERMDELAMQANEVLMRISEHAAADMGDFISLVTDKEGRPTGDFKVDLAKAQAGGKLKMIKKLKVYDKVLDKNGEETLLGRTFEIELHDAQRSLETLAKHHGLLDATGRDGDPIHVNIPQLGQIFERVYGEGPAGKIIDVSAEEAPLVSEKERERASSRKTLSSGE